MKKINSCLISMFSKDGVDELLMTLDKFCTTIYATGGTYKYIAESNYKNPLVKVEDITGYPSILGGRVKTLHPKVFGGILNRRNFESDINDVAQYEIPAIDMVIVDLYPFEKTVESGSPEEDIIEKIDIGGVSLIRAAAKNFEDVLIVSSVEQLPSVTQYLAENEGCTSLEMRRKMAAMAFSVTSHYDTAIFNYFNIKENLTDCFTVSHNVSNSLRYGENPHQSGAFFGNLNDVFTQLHGKEISYNNLVDIDSAVKLVAEFDKPSIAIIKHTNVCGFAERDNFNDAWRDALAGDPVSAFGGVIVANGAIDDVNLANEINKLFFEVLIADDFSDEVLNILFSKKNRIILKLKNKNFGNKMYKSVLNGTLVQDVDSHTDTEKDFQYVTNQQPNAAEVEDLIFANKLVKHTKSNAIVLAKGKQLIGSGTGQTSRVDALRQAIAKAKAFNFDLNGAVMASDAFFPFADCVEIAHAEGIDAIIQPGGSVRDNDSIEYCNNNGMRMVFTGHRHFKH